MTDVVLVAKLALGVTSAVAAVVLCRWPAPFALSDERFTRLAMATLVASRLAIWIALYVVLGLDVQSDVPVVYLPQALEALAGGIVYADIDSSYGPLFPYLVALPVAVWSSSKAIVLFTIGVECAAVAVWMRVGRLVASERTVRAAALLYLVSPIAILMNPVAGSNQVWVMLAAGTASWFLVRGRDVASGLTLAAGVVGVKALAALFAPALWMASRAPRSWLIALTAPVVLAYGALAVAGVDVLAPLQYESSLVTSGNLPFVLREIGIPGGIPATLPMLGVWLAILLLNTWWSTVAREQGQIVYLTTAALLLFMLLSPKAHANYIAMFLFPLCLTFAAGGMTPGRLLSFGAVAAAAAIEPSLHFRWFQGLTLQTSPGGDRPLQIGMFLVVEALLLTGYGWMARAGYQLATGQSRPQ